LILLRALLKSRKVYVDADLNAEAVALLDARLHERLHELPLE
jgi:hypothetical protein